MCDEHLCEHLVITRDEFEKDLEITLGRILLTLTKAGYECQVYDDDTEIIVINYNNERRLNYGNPTLEWLTEDEREYIETLRRGDKNDEQGSN